MSKVIELIYLAIDELNQTLAPEKRLVKARDTVLSGPMTSLDSLGMVNLVVETEQQIEEAFGVTINLADQQLMSETQNPFETVETLASYVCKLLPCDTKS